MNDDHRPVTTGHVYIGGTPFTGARRSRSFRGGAPLALGARWFGDRWLPRP